MLTKRGLRASDLVCSPDVADTIINDAAVQKLLDNRRIDVYKRQRQDYLERIDSYQNRTYKAHGRALLRMAEILKESRENDGDDRWATD